MPTPTNRNDILRYGPAANAVGALAGDDLVFARAGDDLVFAGAGDDTVHGNADRDGLFGGAGRDGLYGGAGRDGLDGGPGVDAAYYGGSQAQYRIITGGGGVTGVRNLQSGRPDGIDFLIGVERLVFADGVVLLAPDRAPDAVDDAAATDEDTALTLAVLANDADRDGDALTLAALSDADPTLPGHQTAVGATISLVGGQVHYDPTTSASLQALASGQSLADGFSYAVDDGFGGTDATTVAVTVAGRDDPPAHYRGVLRAGQQGAGQIPPGANPPFDSDPAHSNYWAVEVVAGQTIELRVDPAEAALVPAFWLFAGVKQPSDFAGGVGFDMIYFDDPGYLVFADDGPRSFTASADGVYTLIVTSSSFSGDPGPDGVYDYNIFVS